MGSSEREDNSSSTTLWGCVTFDPCDLVLPVLGSEGKRNISPKDGHESSKHFLD